MNIEIGDKFIIKADQYQYVLHEKKIAKEGNNIGKQYYSVVGYYPKLRQLISALINLDVKLSDVKSLQDMEKRIEMAATLCEQAFNATKHDENHN